MGDKDSTSAFRYLPLHSENGRSKDSHCDADAVIREDIMVMMRRLAPIVKVACKVQRKIYRL